MKRITSIQLENFRAFYKSYEPIVLPNGENLLLYGENGSGKSSLFKALKTYFQSSRNAASFPFELNSYVTTPLPIQGNVQINFFDVIQICVYGLFRFQVIGNYNFTSAC